MVCDVYTPVHLEYDQGKDPIPSHDSTDSLD